MSVGTSAYRMADRLLDGKLADLIAQYRAAGMTWDQVSRQLYIDGGVEVTNQTLINWAEKLGIPLERPGRESA